MTQDSPPDLLVLHAVRILGFADTPAIAQRFGTDRADAAEILLDAEARGWLQHAAFADLQGWSLTDSGRMENERQLADELASTGNAGEIRDTYGDRLAVNDHRDPAWDAAVLGELTAIDLALAPLVDSCHRVWFQLHEDLIATLGLDRRTDP